MTCSAIGTAYGNGNGMGAAWKTFRKFWTAEEVPRWFGLSLLLVYLMSLGGVGYFGIREVRRDTTSHYFGVSQYAIQALTDRLRVVIENATDPQERVQGIGRELGDFAASVSARSVRVLNKDRLISASISSNEIGTICLARNGLLGFPTKVELLPVEDGKVGDRLRLLRAPLHLVAALSIPNVDRPTKNGTTEGAEHSFEELYVEATVDAEPDGLESLVTQTTTLLIVLVSLGALFGLHRCLRSQLRCMNRIAGRLEANRDRLHESLAYLHLADASDTVTCAWNELVELARSLSDHAQRDEAAEELSRVLQRSPGGALAEALNAVPEGLLYVTDETRIEYINNAACHMFGWAPDEARSMTLPNAQAEGIGASALEILRGAKRLDGGFEERAEMVDNLEGDTDGQTSFRVRVIPVHRANRSGECILMIRDVSQQVRAERAREEFVTQVTHELRTPLTNIRAYTETLSSGMFDDPSVVSECYNVITKETRRLSRLIEDVLSVSQLEVGSIELQLDKVDLRTLLSDGVRDVRGLADEKSIELELLLPAKMEAIEGDRDKLAVVINNLLGNAIKYTMPEGSIFVGVQFSDSAVALTFKDNGMGIDATDQGRIFERFQRGSDPSVQNESGTGIGLFTAREIVRRHGGDIDLISRKGEGSTFVVRLPHTAGRSRSTSTREEL